MDTRKQRDKRNARIDETKMSGEASVSSHKRCKHCWDRVADPNTGSLRLCNNCDRRVKRRTRYTFNPEAN